MNTIEKAQIFDGIMKEIGVDSNTRSYQLLRFFKENNDKDDDKK